jgi:two-component sensor histidine kinase
MPHMSRINALQFPFFSVKMKKTASKLRGCLCVMCLSFNMFFVVEMHAQTLSYLPDSVKLFLKNLPENQHDSIYYDIGSLYYAQFNDEGYSRALDCFKAGLILSEKYGNKTLIMDGNHLIGTVYDAYGDDTEKIIYYYKKAYDMSVILQENGAVLGGAYKLAHAYNLKREYAKSEEYLAKFDSMRLLPAWQAFKDKGGVCVAYLKMKNNDVQGFIKTFESIDKNYPYKDGQLPYARYFALSTAFYAFEKGSYEDAIQTILKTLKTNPSDSTVLISYLSKSYARAGDHKNAYRWMEILDDMNENTIRSNSRKGLVINLLETENAFKEKENQLLALEKKSKDTLNFFLALGLILSLISIGIISILWRNSQKDKKELAKSNAEKALLVHEVQHRVKNNLQLLYSLSKLQLGNIKDENARGIWKKNISQLQSMIDVNEKMYMTEGGGAIDLEPFMTETLAELKHIYLNDAHINISQHIDNDIHVSPQFAISFGLIITELVTNSFKYAITDIPIPFVYMAIKKQEGQKLTFTYSDSGILEDPSVLETKKIGGMPLIKDLTRQLDGHLAIETKPNLMYTFTLPL